MHLCLPSLLFYIDTSPKLNDLMSEVAANLSANKWEVFAIQLGLSFKCIQVIEYKHRGNVYHSLIEVFHEWHIQETSPYTWKTVVNALRSPCVNETVLAEKISKTFLSC